MQIRISYWWTMAQRIAGTLSATYARDLRRSWAPLVAWAPSSCAVSSPSKAAPEPSKASHNCILKSLDSYRAGVGT